MMTQLKNTIQPYQFKLQTVALLILAFFAPFAVVSQYQKALPIATSVLTSFIVLCLLILVWFSQWNPSKNVPNELKEPKSWVIWALLVPAVMAVGAATYNLNYILSQEFVQYYQQSMPRRIINGGIYIGLMVMFLLLVSRMTKSDLNLIGKAYLSGIGILVFFGIWQFLHLSIGYPMPDLQTRSAVHSVQSEVLVNFRLTSLTEEPSFLVPFLMDGLIIGFMLYKRKRSYVWQWLLPVMFVLFFSFSISGYANLLIVGLFALWIVITSRKIPWKKVMAITGASLIPIGLLIWWKWVLVLELLMPIIGRFDVLFDVTNHSRLYMLVYPFVWMFDYSWVNALFGFGPGSYEFLAETKFLAYGSKLSATSNNVFVDLLFEHGLIGGGAFLLAFILFFVHLYKRRNQDVYYQYAVVLWFHLGITSLYRSDFVSPRFWVIVMITILCAELGKRRILGKDKLTHESLRPRKVGVKQ
ncbi:O-antigen ligase family protein [Alkalicoccobacillus gibsonii]|uniref:O-antigen ligase family protein n=1 Tax=Alkalicoccobacillus gibsonii TaxID=79881 RepID=UPI003F7CAA27